MEVNKKLGVNSVNQKLIQALSEPENDIKYRAFINDYCMLLDEVKITTDTANIAIAAVELDQGINFLEAFLALNKKQVQDSWRTIRNCVGFKENREYNALKLMCVFAASALCGELNTAAVIGNIFTAVVNTVKTSIEKDGIQPEAYKIIGEVVIEGIPKEPKFPEWKTIKMTLENVSKFCMIMEKVLELLSVRDDRKIGTKVFGIKKWILNGKQYIEEAKILKEKEKNKPPKRSAELQDLFEHFKNLEEQLDESIEEATRLTVKVNFMQEQLHESEANGRNKDKKIKELQEKIEQMQKTVEQVNQEIDERKKLNDAQVQYRKDTQASLLQDIARALKTEYEDFVEATDIPMNEMLGEFYKEKLKQVFRILDQKGIKAGN